jgi:hypothetical protein
LKISANVSDLSDPYCDWNENWYSDTVDKPEYFDEKKSIANNAILKWWPFNHIPPRKLAFLFNLNET